MPGHQLNYDQLAADYAVHRTIHPGVFQSLVETASLTAQSTVLEVGCGTANYLAGLVNATGCQGYGLDPSAAMLRQASDQSAPIHLQQGRAETLNYANDLFDFIYSVDVIHHVQNRQAYYQAAYRVLKPGGLLCTVTDSASVIERRIPLSSHFPETVAVELARYPHIDGLAAAMSQAGFDHISDAETEFSYQLSSSQAYRDRAFSSLHLIAESAFRAGLAKLERDLARGPIQALSLYTLLWGVKV